MNTSSLRKLIACSSSRPIFRPTLHSALGFLANAQTAFEEQMLTMSFFCLHERRREGDLLQVCPSEQGLILPKADTTCEGLGLLGLRALLLGLILSTYFWCFLGDKSQGFSMAGQLYWVGEIQTISSVASFNELHFYRPTQQTNPSCNPNYLFRLSHNFPMTLSASHLKTITVIIIMSSKPANKNRSLKTEASEGKLMRSILPNFSMKKLHTISEEPLPLFKKHLRYDTTLFHKTIFHLKPMQDNPELFIRERSISSKQLSTLKEWRPIDTKAVLPHPILMKLAQSDIPNKDRMLRDVTLNHITAKKWIIYSMQRQTIVKGYKYRQPHQVASISKLLTFYTAYEIIKEYFITVNNFDLLVTCPDNKVGGTKLPLNTEDETLITLEEALSALIMKSSNNIALTIANNLGSYVLKKRVSRYFSCFDLANENRENNIAIFVGLMRKYAKEMGLTDSTFTNPHGLTGNLSSAIDVARLASECFKIPLFCKISSCKQQTIRPREISDHGEVVHRISILENTNKLLAEGCLGGKTGSSLQGGDSFVGCFEGGIMVVVLGSAGRSEKFKDCMRLVEWVDYKLTMAERLE